MNLWAVVENITKYATKAPSGSKRLGVVVPEVMDELCRYGTDGERDLLKQTCSKVFSRNIGNRDVTILEAVHMGMNLPMIMAQMSVVTFNTLGTRRVKPYVEQLRAGVTEGQYVLHVSRMRLLDDLLACARKQLARNVKHLREFSAALDAFTGY